MADDPTPQVATDIAVIKSEIRHIAHGVETLSQSVQNQIALLVPRGEYELQIKRLEKLERKWDSTVVWMATSFVATLAMLALMVWRKVFG